MFSGVTSSARSPSQTKMMIRRAVEPASCCGAARLLPDPNTKSDKALKQNRRILVFIFMVVLDSQLCAGCTKTNAQPCEVGRLSLKGPGDDLLSHGQSAISSARRRFTVLFGMGRGGANALWSPGILGLGKVELSCVLHRVCT